MPDEADEYDRTIAAEYRMCRIFGHARGTHDGQAQAGRYVQGMVCIRCRAQRSVRIDARNGDRLGSGGYDYQAAPGYLLKGGGPLTPQERSELRLLGVRGHLRRVRRRRAS